MIHPILQSKVLKTLKSALFPRVFIRWRSQSTSIPKKQQRIRDHGFDNYMEVEKKVRKTLKFQSLILSQLNQTLPVARLDTLSRRLGFKQFEAGSFVLKFPNVFEIYEHPVQRILYCRLTRKSLLQIQEEKNALIAQLPDAVTRLRKLLMMSNTGRIRAEHVRTARKEFGLPDDFLESVVLNHPQFFRLKDAKETRNKYIELVDSDPALAVCAIEKVREMEYREKGKDAEDMRFAFVINFPPGFKTGKFYKIAVWKWQRTPYWSPYEDISGYDMRSIESQKRLEKRAVAVIHELISLTVEKKITLERIAHFKMVFDLPNRMKEFMLQHQGIFYISTRGNQGQLHTVFLREAYRRGELIAPNDLYLARRHLSELILTSPRRSPLDEELMDDRDYRRRDDRQRSRREYASSDLQMDGDGFDRRNVDLLETGSINSSLECSSGDERIDADDSLNIKDGSELDSSDSCDELEGVLTGVDRNQHQHLAGGFRKLCRN